MTLIPIKNTNEKERAQAYWDLLKKVITKLHPGPGKEEYRDNIQRFLLHVAWHEGFFLRFREQMDDGPARSFMQFEAMRAKEAVLYGLEREEKFGQPLEDISGKTLVQLGGAAGDLGDSASKYPQGNLIEELLRTNDEFGILLARIAFWKIEDTIERTNDKHAWYWYQHWKKTGGDRPALEEAFEKKADAVDQLLGLPKIE